MSNSEAKHKLLDHKILKRLPGHLSLILALSAFGLAACQKLSPHITTIVPNTDIVLTVIPSNGNVKVLELAANQPGKRIKKLNVGDIVNGYAPLSNIKLNPANANACATAIVDANQANLQPEPADSKGPASAREVIAPEGGLTIPKEACGDLKTNSTPNASPAPKQTQTSEPIATLQTPGKKALINDENIVVVFGTLCGAPILGLGAILFALRGRKKGKNESTDDHQVVLTHMSGGDKSQVPTVLSLQGNDGIPAQIRSGGKFIPVFKDQVAIVIDTDPKSIREVRRLLQIGLVKRGAERRARIARLVDHEVGHIINSPSGISEVYVLRRPSGSVLGAGVSPLMSGPTADEIRQMAAAPGPGRMSEQDQYTHDQADNLAKNNK